MPTTLDTYAPFDTGAGANVTEATWRDFMRHMLGSASGVIRGFLNEFAVTGDGSGMNVKVDTGECWMRGHYGKSTAQKTLAIAAAHATLARKDRVILRVDFTNNRVEVDVLTGTAAASPITPAVTQSTTIWETSLAVVDIPAADTAIAASQVDDDRVFTTVAASYTRLAAQSVPQATISPKVKVAFTATGRSSGDVLVNAAMTDFTLQRSGLWLGILRVRWAVNSTNSREVEITDNGSGNLIYAGMSSQATSINMWQTCSFNEYLPVGTALSCRAYQNSGANLNADLCSLSLMWVGP